MPRKGVLEVSIPSCLPGPWQAAACPWSRTYTIERAFVFVKRVRENPQLLGVEACSGRIQADFIGERVERQQLGYVLDTSERHW